MLLQSSDYLLPAAEAFKQGQLELISKTDLPLHEIQSWSDCTLNIVLVLVSAFFAALTLKSHYRTAPSLFSALSRTNASISLEKNYQLVRQRNLAALSLILPFCLLLDRFRVLELPPAEDIIPAQWHFCLTFALFLAFLLLRILFYIGLRPRSRQEVWHAAKTSAWNFFIVMSILCLVSSAVSALFEASDATCRKVIIYESLLIYMFLLIRKGQILREDYSAFLTFLYLCGLELLPALFLVAMRFVTLI